MAGLGKYFNSETYTGRANVAKATYASFALLYLYFRLKRGGNKPEIEEPPPPPPADNGSTTTPQGCGCGCQSCHHACQPCPPVITSPVTPTQPPTTADDEKKKALDEDPLFKQKKQQYLDDNNDDDCK